MRRVKNALLAPAIPCLCLSLNFFLTGCNTTANHRELWSPDKGRGPYTQQLRNTTLIGRSDHRSRTYTYTVYRQIGEQQPVAPVAGTPLPPAPTSDVVTPSASAPLPPPPGAAPAH